MAQILAHYMCWHTDGKEQYRIGKHKHDYRYNHWKWEKNHDAHHPDRVRSWYQPSTPFYDSSDDKVIADHITLLQDAGVYGIVLDWLGLGHAGSVELHDLGIIHRAAKAVAKQARRRSYPFAICLDCNCYGNLSDYKINKDGMVDYLKRSIQQFVEVFSPFEKGYLKSKEKPILFVFGDPKNLACDCDWEKALKSARTNTSRLSVVVQHPFRNRLWADGAFLWLPVLPTGAIDSVRMWDDVRNELRLQYQELEHLKDKKKDFLTVGLAFAGVEDIYLEDGESGQHLQIVPRRAGRTLRDTLELAEMHPSLDYIQVVTFNDWNEGTQIEPAVEYGDRELDTLKAFASNATNP